MRINVSIIKIWTMFKLSLDSCTGIITFTVNRSSLCRNTSASKLSEQILPANKK